MNHQEIKGVTNPVSRIVFGTYSPVFTQGMDASEVLDAAFRQGINTFDTAAAYGESEAVLGRWIESRGIRSQVNILTKGANPEQETRRLSRACIWGDLARSLERLKTDHVELYLLHRDDEDVPVGEVASILNEYHDGGLIGAFGASNWRFPRILEMNRYCASHGLTPFTITSPSYSLADCIGDPWGGSVTLSGEDSADYKAWLEENQMPVFSYSSLARGFFSGKVRSGEPESLQHLPYGAAEEYGYPVNMERLHRAEQLAGEKGASVAQIALAWLLHQKINVFPVTGSGSVAHLTDNLKALQISLTEEEANWLHG